MKTLTLNHTEKSQDIRSEFLDFSFNKQYSHPPKSASQLDSSLDYSEILHGVVNALKVGIIIVKQDDEVIYCNQNFQQMWKIHESLLKFNKDKKLLLFLLNQLKNENKTFPDHNWNESLFQCKFERILELNDGKIFESFSQPINPSEKELSRILVFRDITKQKESEQELNANQLLEKDKNNTPQKSTVDTQIFPICPQLKEVFDFIEANYHLAISLNEVAQVVGYSPAYLTDLVHQKTGHTVNNWIIKRRMVAACVLLVETNNSIEMIAETVGYQNCGHFFRQFRQHYGTTPLAWRKAQQSKTINGET